MPDDPEAPLPPPADSAPLVRERSNVPLISLALAVVALAAAIVGQRFAFFAVVLIVPAAILATHALIKHYRPQGLAIVAVFVSVAAFFTGSAVSVAFLLDEPDVVASTPVVPTDSPAASTASPSAPADQPGSTTAEPRQTIPDGDWLVGTDIEAGTYRTVNVVGSGPARPCDWTVSADASGDPESWREWGLASGGRPLQVLQAGQWFESIDCGSWMLVDTNDFFEGTTTDTFRDGFWIVGEDIKPGTYRTMQPVSQNQGMWGCSVEVYSDFVRTWETQTAYLYARGGIPTFTLKQGEVFNSSDCGTWERVDPSTFYADPDTRPTIVPEGVWLVGEDIAPGTYMLETPFEAADEYDSCTYQVFSTWGTIDPDAYQTSDSITSGNATVGLSIGWEFTSVGCPNWVRQ